MRQWLLSLLLVAAAFSAEAQVGSETGKPVPPARPPDTEADTVEISLEGDACPAPDKVLIVLNGKEETHSAVKKDDRWVWSPKPPLRFDRKTVRAYVRFAHGRTDYQAPSHYAHHTLTFSFQRCSEEPLPNLKVEALGKADRSIDISVRYDRELGDQKKCPTCNNFAILTDKTVYAVWFSVETLSLQLAGSTAAPRTAGLLVSAPASEPLFFASGNPRDHHKILPNPRWWKHPPEQGLSFQEVFDAIDGQNGVTNPRWNSDSRTAAKQVLQQAGVERLFPTLE